jgi:hypothetical protein
VTRWSIWKHAVIALLAFQFSAGSASAWFDLPSNWNSEVGDDSWSSISPADAAGNQTLLLLPYVRPFSGNFLQWFDREVPTLMESILGATTDRGPLTAKMRILDPNGVNRYGPVNTYGYWHNFAGGLGAWVWAYPARGGAQIVAVVIRLSMPLPNAAAYDAVLAAGRLADYAQPVKHADFIVEQQEPATSNGASAAPTENCRLVKYETGAYQTRDCGTCSYYRVPTYSYLRRCS